MYRSDKLHLGFGHSTLEVDGVNAPRLLLSIEVILGETQSSSISISVLFAVYG